MKKLIIITFILSFLTTSIWSETLSLEDLVKRDDIYYQKFSNIPYSGKIIGTKTGKIENGIMVGEWLSYFKSGQLEFIHNYKNGQRNGPWKRYYENGQIFEKGNFKNGRIDGYYESYYESGQLSSNGNWKGSNFVGIWKIYYKHGGLKEVQNYNQRGKEDGLWTWYHIDGSIKKTETWNNGLKIK